MRGNRELAEDRGLPLARHADRHDDAHAGATRRRRRRRRGQDLDAAVARTVRLEEHRVVPERPPHGRQGNRRGAAVKALRGHRSQAGRPWSSTVDTPASGAGIQATSTRAIATTATSAKRPAVPARDGGGVHRDVPV